MLKYISRTFCLLSSAVLLQEPLAASEEEKGLISIHSPPPAHHQVCQPQKDLTEELRHIQALIDQSHKESNTSKIMEAYCAFVDLPEYSEDQWQQIANSRKAIRWPSQKTARDVVGGDLFYPRALVNDYMDSLTTKDLMNNGDMVKTFLYAAKFGHSLGKFYFPKVLREINSSCSDNLPFYFCKLATEAIKELETSSDPDACYVVADSYETAYLYLPDLHFDIKKTFLFHQRATDPKNQLGILYLRKMMMSFKYLGEPSVQDFLDFGRQYNYGPAFMEAVDLFNEESEDNKIQYLQEAISMGYNKALIRLGDIYQDMGEDELAKNCFKRAGEKGIALGYLEEAYCILGQYAPSGNKLDNQLSELSPEQIQEVLELFKKAGDLGHPKGVEYLTTINLYLFEEAEEANDEAKMNKYNREMWHACLKGIQMGNPYSYYLIEDLFPENYEAIVEEYGYGLSPKDPKFLLEAEKFLTGTICKKSWEEAAYELSKKSKKRK